MISSIMIMIMFARSWLCRSCTWRMIKTELCDVTLQILFYDKILSCQQIGVAQLAECVRLTSDVSSLRTEALQRYRSSRGDGDETEELSEMEERKLLYYYENRICHIASAFRFPNEVVVCCMSVTISMVLTGAFCKGDCNHLLQTLLYSVFIDG